METTSIRRYGLLDAIRGLLVINMMIYHALYFLYNVIGNGMEWYNGVVGYIWQQSICWGFIFLSGVCRAISNNAIKRGSIVIGCGFLVTIGTLLFAPQEAIHFGVLTFIGSAMLIMIPLEKIFAKVYAPFGFIASGILFLLFRNVYQGNLGFEGLTLMQLPTVLYWNRFTAYLGFPPSDFTSGDYFPLLPWIFLYFCGYFLWNYIKKKETILSAITIKIPILDFVGKKSLWFYMLVQPVVFGLIYVFCIYVAK